ncbi:AP2 domain-containing protein, partial [Candidatus Pacearchaeota archaeon]|nr:AP2 domain-containing protein [Candidatus Pacearchaeota archaeon]
HGKTHSKFFSDKKIGGRNLALLKAISWRDKTRVKIGKPQIDPACCTCCTQHHGIVGVCLDE